MQEILSVYLYCQWNCRQYLSEQLADHSWGDRTAPCGDGSSVCHTKRHSVGDFGMETPDPWLENRKRFVAPPRKYLVPLAMLLMAAFVGTYPPVLGIWSAVLLMECGILLYWARRE